MEAKELRIGNYVYRQSDKMIINRDSIYQIEVVTKQTESKYDPIPLTENCPIKLNDEYWDFIGYGTRIIYLDRLHSALKIEQTKINWAFYFNDELIGFNDYVHDAQNLYFALTKEELSLY